MKTPYFLLQRCCAWAAVILGAYAVMSALAIMDCVPMPEAAEELFVRKIILYLALLLAVMSCAFFGVARARGQWFAPKGWLIFKRIVFWSLLVASFVLVCTEVSLNKALGALLALVWMVWAVLALFAQLIAFVVSRVAKKGK